MSLIKIVDQSNSELDEIHKSVLKQKTQDFFSKMNNPTNSQQIDPINNYSNIFKFKENDSSAGTIYYIFT